MLRVQKYIDGYVDGAGYGSSALLIHLLEEAMAATDKQFDRMARGEIGSLAILNAIGAEVQNVADAMLDGMVPGDSDVN